MFFGAALSGMDWHHQEEIFHGMKNGISQPDAMLSAQYHDGKIPGIMVLKMIKPLILKEINALICRFSIMVFSER
ncbi:hypothetical protein ACLBWS_16390 [Brucellaceae bacterium D45D]